MADKDDKKGGAADGSVARADAAGGATLDQVLATMNTILTRVGDLGTSVSSVIARVDSMEAEVKADKAKADADETEEEKAKAKADADAEAEKAKAKADADAEAEKEKAKADAEAEAAKTKADSIAPDALAAIRKDIESVAARIPMVVSDKDYAAMADAQAKADRVYQAFGDAAPRPLQGESLLSYRRRLAVGLKSHSADWRGVDLLSIADAAAFDVIETKIYADALHTAHNPTDLPEGELRAIVSVDSTGRRITTFAGRPSTWMSSFSANRRRLVGIGRKEH